MAEKKQAAGQGAESAGFNPNDARGEMTSVEFWKPGRDNRGQTLLGRMVSFGTGRVGADTTEHVVIEPALLLNPDGKGLAFAALKVGLNSVLKARITPAARGAYMAIRFDGGTKTRAGSMRVFSVYEMTAEACGAYFHRTGHGAIFDGAIRAATPTPDAARDFGGGVDFGTLGDDDELPF